MGLNSALYLAVVFFQCYSTGQSENADFRSGTVSSKGCQYKQYDKMYFYGPVIKVQRNVADIDECVSQCWKFVVGGTRRCQAVNYVKTDKRCEMMHQQFNVNDKVLVRYYGDRNPNAAYCVPINCTAEEQTGGPKGSCGETSIDPMRSINRIIGGTEAKRGSIPWIVSIRQGFSQPLRHFCGGTLVRVSEANETDIVITAAHCNEDGLAPDMVEIVAGSHDLLNPMEGEQSVEYEDWVSHEGFDKTTLDNDIAIIKLATPIKFGKTAQPACLPKPGDHLADETRGLVAGWGNTKEGSGQALLLQQLPVPIIKTETCANYYKKAEPPKEIKDKIMICAGYHEGGKDACQGDSGGPLTFKNDKGHYTLQGVVSFGKGCARAEMPGVYARVSEYIDWINKKIKKMSKVAKN